MKNHYEIAIHALHSLAFYKASPILPQEYKNKAEEILKTLTSIKNDGRQGWSPAAQGFLDGIIQAIASELRANG